MAILYSSYSKHKMDIAKKIWSKSKRKAGYILGNTKHFLKLDSNFYKNARGSRILIYHGICKSDPQRFNTLFIDEQQFEEHLNYYKTFFKVVSLDDFYAQRFSKDKFNICLTFDDGFANNYHYVLPLLNKYQIPATFFITAIRDTGFDILWNDFLTIASKYGPEKITIYDKIYSKNRFKKYENQNGIQLATELRMTGFKEKAALINLLQPIIPFKNNKADQDYWLQMTAAQIKELSTSPLVTIGSHGYYHNDLSKLNPVDVFKEMVTSKKYLENVIDKEIISFAFPYGAYNSEAISAANKAGYKQLLAARFSNITDKDNLLLKERFTINPFISTPNQMHDIIIGKNG